MFKITTLDKYIFGQLLLLCLMCVLIFTIVWIAPEILLDVIALVAKGQLNLVEGFLYLIYQIPEVFLYSIPAAAMIGVVFLFQRLSTSSELIAMMAGGIGFWRLSVPVLAVAVVLSTFFCFSQEVLLPNATTLKKTMSYEKKIETKDPASGYVTLSENDTSGGLARFLLYVKTPKSNENAVLDVGLETVNQDNKQQRYVASMTTGKTAFFDTENSTLNLKKGTQYSLSSEGVYTEVVPFDEKKVKVPEVLEDLMQEAGKLPIQFSTLQLAQEIQRLSALGQAEDNRYLNVRFYQRFVQPLCILVLAVVAMFLGVEKHRSARLVGLGFGALLLVVFNIVNSASTTIGAIGLMPAVIAAVLPLFSITLLGVGLVQIRQKGG